MNVRYITQCNSVILKQVFGHLQNSTSQKEEKCIATVRGLSNCCVYSVVKNLHSKINKSRVLYRILLWPKVCFHLSTVYISLMRSQAWTSPQGAYTPGTKPNRDVSNRKRKAINSKGVQNPEVRINNLKQFLKLKIVNFLIPTQVLLAAYILLSASISIIIMMYNPLAHHNPVTFSVIETLLLLSLSKEITIILRVNINHFLNSSHEWSPLIHLMHAWRRYFNVHPL